MPYVEATGAKLYFEESGYGYPIIFIHEFVSDMRGWDTQISTFSRSYRCIAYNARGYPPSDVPENPLSYGWELAVDDIAALMRHLGIERAHLIGLSMGGYNALQFGLRHLDKVSAIVAGSVGSGCHPAHRDAWLRETSVLSRIFVEHGMVAMAERMARGPARVQLKYKDRQRWREFILRLRRPDGHDVDLDALVRARCGLRAGSGSLDRVHLTMRPQGHDLAVTPLVDVSLSTDAWIDEHRVLDVEKEALLVLANGLSACGDHHSILTLTSRRCSWVRVETVKAFDKPMTAQVEMRVGALKPGYYTRIGAAVRHAASERAAQPQRKNLLIVLTDGKPNDVDHYEGRFAVEDTRKAVQEARWRGTAVFDVTIDSRGPELFTDAVREGGYAIVGNIKRLPAALPAIYRQLTQ